MLSEEHGLQKVGLSPLNSAMTTFVAFLVVGAMPLVAYLVPMLDTIQQFLASLLLAGIMFCLISMLKSLVFVKPALRSGIHTLLMGEKRDMPAV